MKTSAEILKEFDEKFPNLLISGGTLNGRQLGYKNKRDELKSFLLSTLDERMEWVRGITEGLKKETHTAGYHSTSKYYKSEVEGYNQALQDVLNSITKGSKED